MQEAWVPSPVGEVRCHMLCGSAKKKKEPDVFVDEKGGQGEEEQHDEWEDGWK